MALGGTYDTGTITVVSGENTASFDGALLTSVAEEGDIIHADGNIGYIASVDSDSAVTFEQPWAGSSLTSVAYTLFKTSWLRYDPAITQAKIREFIAYIKGQGSFLFVTGATPDPAMGEDGQYALKTNGGPWQLWYKTGGVWEAQGIPVGTTFRGEWDSATEYFANDQVGYQGSTWGAIAGSTNVAPGTDETKWSLSAQKGADGKHGGAVSFTQVFSTSTSNADPGDGMLRLNNATQPSATVIRTDYLDKDGNSLTDLIGSLTTGTSTVKGQIRLAEVGDPTRWIIFDLTAKSDMTGYFNLTVAHVAHSTNPLRDGEEIGFYFTPKGDVGAQGVIGDQGYAPVLAVVSDGNRRVFQVTDWTGSTGIKPATGKYVGISGLVDAIGDAIDVRGAQGIQGEQGLGIQPDASGPLADRDTHDDEAAGFVFVDTDATPFDLYIKLSATTADWSAASPIGGAGDMLASVYDPTAVAGDAFDLDNMSPAPGTTGKALFTATNAADARDTLGVTTVGEAVFVATDAATARTALEIQPGMSDVERQNSSLDRIYLSKALDAPQRRVNSFADGYTTTDGINAGSSSNYTVDTTNGNVTNQISSGTTVTINTSTSSGGWGAARTLVDRTTALLNGETVGKIEYYTSSPVTLSAMIVKRNSAGNYDVVYSQSFAHPGSGWSGVSPNFTVPATGTYYLAAYEPNVTTNFTTSVSRASMIGLASGTGVAMTEDTNTVIPSRYTYNQVPLNMTVVTTAQPTDANVSNARVLIEFDNTDTPTLDTDITVEVTCDGGSNWASATLSAVTSNSQGGRKIAETADTACTAGTSFAARIKTANGKSAPIYGVSVAVH